MAFIFSSILLPKEIPLRHLLILSGMWVQTRNKQYIGKGTFGFAIKLIGPNPDILLDPTYFSLVVGVGTYKRADPTTSNGSFAEATNYTFIDMELCGQNFPLKDDTVYNRIGLASYYCPKSNDYYIASNFNSESYSQLEINLFKCSTGTCKSNAEMETALNSHYFDIAVLNSYFDFEDYDTPIKTYVEDLNFYGLISNLNNYVQFK